jgi:hypothetical protein
MEAAKSGCCKTKFPRIHKGNRANGSMSFLSTALLILIPKCPLCFSAYMGAAVMFFDIEHAQLAPVLLHAKPILGGFILLMILLNRRGKRTVISLIIAGLTLVFLLLKTYYALALVPDWLLYTAFIFAIWYNGNFQYFYRFLRFGRQKHVVS